MNPASKGWLKDYLAVRKDVHRGLTTDSLTALHPDHSLYKIVQPTGLMYGQPVRAFEHPDAVKWNNRDRMKVLLADCLIGSSMLFHGKPLRDDDEVTEITERALESINNFYNHIFPELSTPTKTIFGRHKSPAELAERILEKRIENAVHAKGDFWTQFFHNSLLFLDVFIFGQWIHTNADKVVSDFFKYEREELRTSLVKIMAAAAHANHIVEFEERKLMEYFLHTAHLQPDKRKECMAIFDQGISVEEINLPTSNSWILKKFFLEIAILTIWADKRVEAVELDFLRRLAETLSFAEDDLDNSLLAIEGFVLEHWQDLTHLQDKKSHRQVCEEYIRRISKVTDRSRGRLIKEARQNDELMSLLAHARANELHETEKTQLRKLLIDVLRTVPTFTIVSLPANFLTLPVLIQVLPRNFIADSMSQSVNS